MQPGVVGLRSALIAAWEADLRAVRQDTFEVGRGREALVFIQRFYALISDLRAPIPTPTEARAPTILPGSIARSASRMRVRSRW